MRSILCPSFSVKEPSFIPAEFMKLMPPLLSSSNISGTIRANIRKWSVHDAAVCVPAGKYYRVATGKLGPVVASKAGSNRRVE